MHTFSSRDDTVGRPTNVHKYYDLYIHRPMYMFVCVSNYRISLCNKACPRWSHVSLSIYNYRVLFLSIIVGHVRILLITFMPMIRHTFTSYSLHSLPHALNHLYNIMHHQGISTANLPSKTEFLVTGLSDQVGLSKLTYSSDLLKRISHHPRLAPQLQSSIYESIFTKDLTLADHITHFSRTCSYMHIRDAVDCGP